MFQTIRRSAFLFCLTLFLYIPLSLPALETPGIFTDHMVLQRDKPVVVWGSGNPGATVTVSFAGQTKEGTVNEDGKWTLKLDPLKASFTPRTLKIISSAANSAKTFRNVLVGEVWLFSGQSNMGMNVKGVEKKLKEDPPRDLANRDLGDIRFFSPPARDGPLQVQWTVSTPKNVASRSAVAFYSARALLRDMNVPVGMIVCAKGGTMLQTWVSKTGFENHPELKKQIVDAWERTATESYLSELMGEAWKKKKKKTDGDVKKAIRKTMGPGGQKPSINFRRTNMAQIAPYTLRGFTWYQGESNAWGFAIAERYRRELRMLVADWRRLWGKQDLPFVPIELPHYPTKKRSDYRPLVSPWCIVIDAQRRIKNDRPSVFPLVTIDLGAHGDIHPPYKKPIGDRWSRLIQNKIHGKNVVPRGPVFDSMKKKNGKLHLTFNHTHGGLVTKEVPPSAARADRVEGFLIAGKDRFFVRARAKIRDDDTIVCWSDRVEDPVAVRYAFSNRTIFNLYNEAGLPAGPFRTDDWSPDTPAREQKSLPSSRLRNPPSIDGTLNDPAWKNASSLSGLQRFFSYRSSEYPTQVMIRWDNSHLYAGFVCKQPLDELRAKAQKRDEKKLWRDDNVQLFLDVNHDRKTYKRFAINPEGTVADGQGFNDWQSENRLYHQGLLKFYRDMKFEPNMKLTVATGKTNGAWTVELAIPWSSLGFDTAPDPGTSMGLQVTRTHAGSEERTEWATTGRDYNVGAVLPFFAGKWGYVEGRRLYHGVGRFGTLHLKK